MRTGIFLRDIHFPVQEAAIYGFIEDDKGIPPGLSWYLEVQAEEKTLKITADDPEDEEVFASPRMSFEFVSPPMRRWFELEGQTVDSNASPGFPAAFSCFEEHEAIPYSTLKFVKRAGNKLQIHWEGKCDPFLGEPYDKDVPFLIQTEAVFKELTVKVKQSDTEATTLAHFSEYLDPADFIQHPIKEVVHNVPIEGMFEPLLRRLFGFPATRRHVTRHSKFELRA